MASLAEKGRLRDLFTSACRKAGLKPDINSKQCWDKFRPHLLKDLRINVEGKDELTIYIIAGNHTNIAHIQLKEQKDDRVSLTRPADLYLSADCSEPEFVLLSRLDNDRIVSTAIKNEAQRPEMRAVIYRCEYRRVSHLIPAIPRPDLSPL